MDPAELMCYDDDEDDDDESGDGIAEGTTLIKRHVYRGPL